MPMGYNHNIRYHGRVYHAQTEACEGVRPVVVTHLFLQGTVVANLRREYKSLPGEPEHDEQLRKQMQEQHKEMMKYLHRGELDARIAVLVGPEDEPAPTAEPALAAGAAAPGAAPPPTTAASIWSEPTAPSAAQAESQAAAAEAAQPQPPPVKTLKLHLPPPPGGLPLPSPATVAAARSKPLVTARPASTSARGPELVPEHLAATVKEAELGDALTEAERRVIQRGTSISREVAAVPLPAGGRIPFDHPAFQGFPMLDLDLGGEESLELDLDAVSQLELDKPAGKPAGDERESLELAEPWPAPPPAPPTAAEPLPPAPPPVAAASEADPPARTPAAMWQPAPPAGKLTTPRLKKPSLPMAPVVSIDLPDDTPDDAPDGRGHKR